MAGNEYHPVRPKSHLSPDGVELRERILAGSPLAVQGILLESLREYFTDPDAPYRWHTDANTTQILIETGRNVQLEANNPSRGVFVTRNGSTPVSIMLGDRVGIHRPSGQESFLAHMATSIQVDCVSATQGECELLADYVHHFLIASRKVFEAQFGLHEMSLATLGPLSPYVVDTTYYAISLTFNIVHAFRWTTVRIAPIIEQLVLRTLTRGGMPPAPGSAREALEAPYDAAFAEAAYESITRNMPAPPDDLPPPDRT